MAQTLYSAVTGAAVALTAATAKSVLSVTSGAQFGVDLKKIRIGFDGVTSTDKAVLVDVCYSTFATAGTTTAGTVNQIAGRTIATTGMSTAYNYTVEPTVLTIIDQFLLSPYNGTAIYDIPLGDTYDTAVSQGFVIRCTAPTSAVNCRATMIFGRT